MVAVLGAPARLQTRVCALHLGRLLFQSPSRQNSSWPSSNAAKLELAAACCVLLTRCMSRAGADIAALLAAGWKGLGRLGGERTEPCMSRALATWPGPREAELVGSPQWLDGLTEEACPALLQLEGEISGVVSSTNIFCSAL